MAASKKVRKADALRTRSVEELATALKEQRQELFTLRFKHATAQLEKTSALKDARRRVARIMTVLQEKGQGA